MDFAKILRQIDTIQSKQTLTEGWEDMMKANKEKAKEKGTDKFDKKETSTGTAYTRKASTFSDGGDDKDTKKAKEKAKKTKVKEGDNETDLDEGIGDMVKKGVDAAKKVGSAALDKLGHGSDDDLIKDLQKKAGVPQTGKKPETASKETVSEETVEEDDVEEGNAYSGALKAAKDAGKEEFEVDGKKYKVSEGAKPDFLDIDKDGDKKEPLKKAAKEKKKVDEAMAECYDQAMGQMQQPEQESGINISSNMDTKTGNQSLTVTAQGAAADELAQLLKLSGVLGGGRSQPQEIDMAMEQGEYANAPHEQVQSMSSQLQQGNDLNRPKKTYPRVAGGDNPMQAVAAMEARSNAAIAEIEKRLMEQLESIKVAAPKAKYENSYKKPTAVKQKK
jgi:hypothetical protein